MDNEPTYPGQSAGKIAPTASLSGRGVISPSHTIFILTFLPYLLLFVDVAIKEKICATTLL